MAVVDSTTTITGAPQSKVSSATNTRTTLRNHTKNYHNHYHLSSSAAPYLNFSRLFLALSILFSLIPLSSSFIHISKNNSPTMTFLKQSSSISSAVQVTSSSPNMEKAKQEFDELAKEMDNLASSNIPFTQTEQQQLKQSFYNLFQDKFNENEKGIKERVDNMWKEFDILIKNFGHLSHKDWSQTKYSSDILTKILLPNNDGLTDDFKHMFHRVLHEGNWDNAWLHAQHQQRQNCDNKPWAVLVTGVNGIRKTTSVYQPWFPTLLEEALVPPVPSQSSSSDDSSESLTSSLLLPTGQNSFFRQLDHMIATISNCNFQQLYELTSRSHDFNVSSSSSSSLSSALTTTNPPGKEIIQLYSNYKASIFKRYRTLSEILGITLIQQAMNQNLNVMIETSGRDVAMFHYIDMFFPKEDYNKLVLHFEINDLRCAEESVDRRMVKEMEDAVKVLSQRNHDFNGGRKGGVNVRDVISVNAGGPYGSEVLSGIQKDSDAVWNLIKDNEYNDDGADTGKVGHDWFKASIKINASSDKDWTARAILPNGGEGQVFTFEAPRQV